MPDKKLRVVKKGTFEAPIEGGKSFVDKDYVDNAHPEADVYTYQEALDILEGNGG